MVSLGSGARGRSESTSPFQWFGVVQPGLTAHAILRRPACPLSNLLARIEAFDRDPQGLDCRRHESRNSSDYCLQSEGGGVMLEWRDFVRYFSAFLVMAMTELVWALVTRERPDGDLTEASLLAAAYVILCAIRERKDAQPQPLSPTPHYLGKSDR